MSARVAGAGIPAQDVLRLLDEPALIWSGDVAGAVWLSEKARRWFRMSHTGPWRVDALPDIVRAELLQVNGDGDRMCRCPEKRRLVSARVEGTDGHRMVIVRLARRTARTLSDPAAASVADAPGAAREEMAAVPIAPPYRNGATAEDLHLPHDLQQESKLDSLGQLAVGIVHDFRNLLTALRGHAEFLHQDIGQQLPESLADVEAILGTVQRGEELTRQLLTFARERDPEVRQTQINDVARSTLKMLRRVIPDSIEIRTELEPELPPVCGDPGLFDQVFVNLMVNARDAVQETGRISIRTLLCDVTEPPRGLSAGSYVVLSVSDDGIGMTADVQRRVFEPFFTTKAETGGTGIGLAAADTIIRQAHGWIAVASEPGRGTCFSIYLPVWRDADE